MYYCVVPGTAMPFIGMAKKEPFTKEIPDLTTEPGELWFQFGMTSAEAYWKITDKMIKMGLEKNVIFCNGGFGFHNF